MCPTVKLNFRSDKTFARTRWSCWESAAGCPELDSQEHIKVCLGYSDLRVGKDLTDDSDLVTFFRQVIQRREDKGGQ